MRTRILPLLITMLFALSLASNAAANENSKMTPGTIAVVNNPDSNDRLNLRTNPSPDAPTLGKYYNGTYLEVLSNEKNGWVKVSIFDLEGYMMAKFLVYPEQLEVGSSTVPSVKINNIGGTGLNLRKAQSTDSSSLGLYSNESTVRVFGVSETWCHVQTEDGNVGFMLREQLSPVLEYQKSSNSAVVNNPDSNDRLNLRTNPSPDAPTLGKYYNGTYLEVLSNEKNGWVKVSIFDLEGYMMAKFLVYPEQLEVGSSTVPSVKINNIGGTGLNLRKAQSTDSSSLGLYSNESTVRVFGVSETWCHVQTEDGNVGFMLREQLSPVLEYQKSSNSAVVNNPNSIGRLNLRTKPSQEAPSLGKYYSGTSVEVLSGDENGWTKVRFHTLEGYMMTKYLVFGQEQFKVGYAMPSVKINNTKGVGLNLRQDQSTNSPSLGLYNVC